MKASAVKKKGEIAVIMEITTRILQTESPYLSQMPRKSLEAWSFVRVLFFNLQNTQICWFARSLCPSLSHCVCVLKVLEEKYPTQVNFDTPH